MVISPHIVTQVSEVAESVRGEKGFLDHFFPKRKLTSTVSCGECL